MAMLCLLFLLPTVRLAADNKEHTNALDDDAPELWFPVGETFRYQLQWGVLRVGEAWMATEWDELDGRRVLAIRGGARTTSWVVQRIYPIRNDIEVMVDPETFLPLTFSQQLREGRRRRDESLVFFHEKGYAEYTSHRTGEVRNITINPDTRDLLTLFYVVRRDGLTAGETAEFEVLVDDDIYDLTLNAEMLERVPLPDYGSVRSMRIEPTAKFGEVFVRSGRMWGWLSDDDRRICVRLSAELPVASVHAILTDVGGPGDDHWVE